MALYNEGKAVIAQGKGAFLNPKMSKLRDISVLFLKAAASKDSKLLDSTAATGIRGIRYSLECGIKDVTLIEINKEVIGTIKSNLKRNKVKADAFAISIQEFSSANNGPFDIVDLDPFGSPAPHVHDLLKICHGGTIFMVTATDTAVLCGAHQSACIKVYNAKPLHNELCKESGIRILLGFIARNASQFNFGIEPMLSISDMHYMRVFVRIKRSANDAVESMNQLGYAASCRSCHYFETHKGIVPEIKSKCKNCGRECDLAGPMWLGKLHDKPTLSKMTRSGSHMREASEMIQKINTEPDTPFFYSVPGMTKSLGMGAVSPTKVIDSLKGKGYSATKTQFEKDSIKTDAPHGLVIGSVRSAAKR